MKQKERIMQKQKEDYYEKKAFIENLQLRKEYQKESRNDRKINNSNSQ
jgi:hypothetical protein